MNIEDAWLELVELKNSWEDRGLPPNNAFFLFMTMMNCCFALANEVSLKTMQKHVARVLKTLYEDLASQENKEHYE